LKFKFTLDPVADYLAASEWIEFIHNDEGTALSLLRDDLARLAPEDWPAGFIDALKDRLTQRGLAFALPDKPSGCAGPTG
jgi:hypothetical protein